MINLQGGPLPVISRVITPLVGVVTPATFYFPPFVGAQVVTPQEVQDQTKNGL